MTRSIVIVDIPFNSVYAYRVGHLIEDVAVTANGWEAYVEASARSLQPEDNELPSPPAAKDK